MSYPKGNAQIGDTAWYIDEHGEMTPEWTVLEVGIPNAHGYPLDIAIGRHGERRVVAPFLLLGLQILPQVIVHPHTIPPQLQPLLDEYETLIVARDGGNTDEERFALLCRECGTRVTIYEDTVEASDLTFVDGQFRQSKPELTGGGTRIRCECEEREYAIGYERHS